MTFAYLISVQLDMKNKKILTSYSFTACERGDGEEELKKKKQKKEKQKKEKKKKKKEKEKEKEKKLPDKRIE